MKLTQFIKSEMIIAKRAGITIILTAPLNQKNKIIEYRIIYLKLLFPNYDGAKNP